ncbi:hypothetical protein Q5752_001357 [Cryptotrichosporon argae]
MAPKLRTDVALPTALPSATLGKRRRLLPSLDEGGAADGPPGAASEWALDAWAEEWNVRIDKDVKGVVGGLREVVELAEAPSASTHLPLRLSSLVRATQRLRDAAHDLRLLLLLSDDVASAARRDDEVSRVKREIVRLRAEVRTGVRGLVGDEEGETGDGDGEHGSGRIEEGGEGGEDAGDGAEKGQAGRVASSAEGSGGQDGSGGEVGDAARSEGGDMDVDVVTASSAGEAPVNDGQVDGVADEGEIDDDFEVVDA